MAVRAASTGYPWSGLWSDSTRHVDLAPRNAAQQLLNTEARLLRPRHIVGRVHRDLLTLFRLIKGDMASEAASWAAMSLQDNPDHQAGLRIDAASNAMAGRPEQAHKAAARLRQLNPKLRLSSLKDVIGPYRHVENVSRLEEGLRQRVA